MARHVFLLLAVASLLLTSFPAAAGDLAYSDIDRATVRVLALGQVDVEVVEHKEARYPVAIPLAGHGSGVLIRPDGLILTAQHVVADSRSVAVMVSGYPKALPAVVVFENPHSDVALIRVLGTYSQYAKLADASAPLSIRQTVFAIGYPLDAKRTDPQSTQGIVSGMLPDGSLQLGMSVNPGNSGGPVVDEAGLVRGIVVARSRLDEGAVGLAYAVPVDKFSGSVGLHSSKALTPEDQRRLRSPSAERLAALTQLMSQYGLEVLEASLSGATLDVDPALQRALDESSEGAHASVDGRLMSAAMYWNQALVGKARGDGLWMDDQRRAIQLAKQAAAIDPALKKDSKFIQIALNVNGRWAEFKSALGDPQPSAETLEQANQDKRVVTMTGLGTEKRKTAGIFLGLGAGSTTLEPARGSVSGVGFRGVGGYWFEAQPWLRVEIGAVVRLDDGGRFECERSDYECSAGGISSDRYGVGGTAVLLRFLELGAFTEFVDVSGAAGDGDGISLEGVGGLRIPTDPVDVSATAFYAVGTLKSRGWTISLDVRF